MSDQQPDKLDKLLDAFDARLRKQKDAQDAAVSREAKFLSEFANFLTLTAHPFFEQIGNRLRSRGHQFEIVNQDREVGRDGKVTDASLALIIYPSGIDRTRYRGNDVPSLMTIASPEKQTVCLRASNMMPGKGGTAGSVGDFKLSDLTPEILERELLKVLSEAFG